MPLDCQMSEESLNMLRAELHRMTLAVERDEAGDPRDLSLLREMAVAAGSQHRADPML